MEQAGWIDKHEAARCLNISTRSVLNLAQSGSIQSKRERDVRNNQTKVLLHAGDVERARHQRENPSEEPAPRVNMESPARGKALTQALTSIAERVTLPAAVRSGPRLFLTIPEAAEYSGLGVGYLRRQIEEGKLELVKGAGPRRADVVRRTDLEKL